MTTEEAQELIVAQQVDYTRPNRILRGMEIIARHAEDLPIAAEHDIIFAGDFESSVSQMSREEVIEMAVLGWFEEYDSWAHHC